MQTLAHPPSPQEQTPFWLHASAAFLILANAFWYFALINADPDLWGHVKFGLDLLENKGLHAVDPYSFTALGREWINHEWLTELTFAGLFSQWGGAGLLWGKMLLGLGLAGVLTACCRKRSPLVAAAVLIVVLSGASPGFYVRPQVFSLAFFTLTLWILRSFFYEGKNWLPALPLLMVLWVNLHGGFLMGVSVVVLAAVWETAGHVLWEKRPYPLKRLWLWTAATCLAPLANPYGFKLLLFLGRTLSIPRPISEWAAMDLGGLSFLPVKALMLLVLAFLLARPKRIRSWEAVCILLTMYASIKHVRHTPFFAIMAGPWLVDALSELVDGVKQRRPEIRLSRNSLAVLASALAVMGAYKGVQTIAVYNAVDSNIVVSPREYPVGAVRFMKENHLTGNLILPFEWGEYAIWHLHPDMLVSIDGRFRTSYPESVIQDHFMAFAHPVQAWAPLMEKYPGDALLVRNEPFFQEMARAKGPWKIIHSDRTAILFLRDNEHNQEAFRRFRDPGFIRSLEPLSSFFP